MTATDDVAPIVPPSAPGSPGPGGGSGHSSGIAVESVTVSYGAGPVVDDVSLHIESGSWLGIIGPNGAGKSSLLKAMAGLVDHTGTIGRYPKSAAALWDPRNIAYVAQRPMLPPGMTVAEYVLLGRSAHLGWLEREGDHDRRIVDDVLTRLAIDRFASRPVTDLSGGEVQRVTLARALAQQASVLLLDEPTSALDIGHRIEVLELIDEVRLADGLTVISAMHDLGSAGRFADRLALLDHGRIVAVGPPTEVLTEPVLGRYYRTPVQVVDADDGGVVVVPLRRSAAARTAPEPAPEEDER